MRVDYINERKMDCVLAVLTEQNRLVVETCLYTGLRCGDVLRLRPDQIKRQFWITEQKTGKRKHVGLSDDLRKRLSANAGKYWVFPGRDPRKHRTRQAVWADLKRAAKAFRLSENLGTHSARKIYAVDMMRDTHNIAAVQKALNHDNAVVTMFYALADTIDFGSVRKRNAPSPRSSPGRVRGRKGKKKR